MSDDDSHGAAGAPSLLSVLVVGAGLIGTSVGLALRRAGVDVYLSDRDAGAAALAADLGAGSVAAPTTEPDLVILALPPSAIPVVLLDLNRRYLTAIFSDVGSVKTKPQVEAEAIGADMTRFIGGHPMAGRERPGPAGARADLFVGRPWVLTPTAASSEQAIERVSRLVELCGADLLLMSAERHDEAVALVSHAPQVMATLTAARLTGAADDLVALAGPGIRDVTRIAASDPELWTDILEGNASVVLAVLDRVAADLATLRASLSGLVGKSTDQQIEEPLSRQGHRAAVAALLAQGNAGRARIPGKHGAPRTEYVAVPVVIPDEPGSLASLFLAAGAAGVNVEDVSIEHSPGQRVGLVELLVQPMAATRLAEALRASGWTVHFEPGS